MIILPIERLLTVLDRKQPDSIPTFEWFIDKNVGLALTGSDDPVDIVEQLNIDGINIRPDYKREEMGSDSYKDEWGMVRKITGDCLDHIVDNPVKDITNHKSYTFPDTIASWRFAALERAVQRFHNERAVILNIRDGFSDMRDLLGYENALISMLTEPASFRELLNRTVEYNLALARRAKKDYNIKIVATTDDIAMTTGLLFKPATYFELIAPAFKEVIKGYRELGLKVIKHCDGDCSSVIDFWIESGIDCLDPVDPGVGFDMEEFKKKYGSKICLKGNIDCKGALEKGRPEEVEEEVRECIRKAGAGGGLILSSSNTIHRGVKPDNYRAMLRALREYGQYQ